MRQFILRQWRPRLLCLAIAGLLLFFLFLGIPVLSSVEVEGDYSDAFFACSSSRSVFRGGTLHGRMLLVGLLYKCRHCPASTFGGNTRFSPIILLLLDLQPERFFKLAFTDRCCSLTKPCSFFYQPVLQPLLVVLSHIFPLQS